MISYFPSAGGLKKAILEYGTIAYVLSTEVTSAALASIKSKIYAIFNYSTDGIYMSTYSSATRLEFVSAPNCSYVGRGAFSDCSRLKNINLFACTSIGYAAFRNCYSLTSIILPNCTEIIGSATSTYGAFYHCYNLSIISLPNISSIGAYTFAECSALNAVYLMNSVVCTIPASSVFLSTPITNSTYTGTFGSIYVPASLLASYQAATGWKNISARIVGI